MENIEEIYKNYANLIKNYIFLITRDNDLAEEIMQDTFASAINQLDKFRGDSEISVWLCSIAKNILYKKAKRDNSINMISIDELDISDSTVLEDDIISKDSKLKLYEALQKLDANTREVMYLRLTGELSFREIGKILHKSENWARVTFFRGKQKLREENFYEIS